MLKTLWLFGQGLAYALRPVFLKPLPPNRWVIANIVVQLAFDVLIWKLWGLKALVYFPLGALLSMGLHPIAGHFLAEHYVYKGTQETASYYGPLNTLAFNVGYHNEHHDFPFIAGPNLPKLRELAPEYYEPLHQVQSWPGALLAFIFDRKMDGRARIKRRGAKG